ncbi:mitochondrial matrix protein [Schizosaccharomyces osmophilus]|uniref:Mitochondrial matrix protein n=1 Tax=Schizosaccharomyces osmophilus TaxID=2545709 RepID=A0AAE9WBN9_9SCHI|nr:mitochondrial matrix protein [Schizosaccharomyces osmophilus]WBW71693.1 mitochondrial matrix protein [Schizosaccharomyces osmophilus]
MGSKVVSNSPKLAVGGPYNQAVKSAGLIFCSGQAALRDGRVVDGTIQEQTRVTIENLAEVLKVSGSSLEKLVKVNIFLADIDDFSAMNEVYKEILPHPMPARTTVAAGQIPLQDKGIKIEIECIAAE